MKLRLLALMATLLLMTACSTSELQTQPANGGDESETSTAQKKAPDLPVGLEVGNLAPEIEGKDLDDVTFKLSDYRGKVILLDFWGDW